MKTLYWVKKYGQEGVLNKSRTVRAMLYLIFFKRGYKSTNAHEVADMINCEAGREIISVNDVRLRLFDLCRSGALSKDVICPQWYNPTPYAKPWLST